MLYTRMNLVRTMLVVACGSILGACGGTDASPPPREAALVYCDNPEVAAPSCSLTGYSLADDSALRTKLEGCALTGCHGMSAITTWTVDLSGSVEEALSSLTTFADGSPYFLVDDVDPDCSQMLAEVTSKPIGLVRMPNTGNPSDYWSSAEADCFRSYLHELYPQ
ncbi:MAG: hypothetical protein WAU39_12910 [Polyangiales bacterium]